MTTDPPEAGSGNRGLYLFGVVRSQAAGAVASAVDADGVGVVEEGELGALVADVGLGDFDVAAGPDENRDLARLVDRVRFHERVLERAAAVETVLPMRFGTVYREEAAVRSFLSRERERLAAALLELADRREWGVKCFLDRRRFAEAVQRASDVAPAAPEVETESPGAAFFARKRAEQVARERRTDTGATLARAVHDRLAAAADRSVVSDPPESSSARDGLLAASYLVAREREPEFHDQLAALAAEHEATGLLIELTGPWPPYSFVGEAEFA